MLISTESAGHNNRYHSLHQEPLALWPSPVLEMKI